MFLRSTFSFRLHHRLRTMGGFVSSSIGWVLGTAFDFTLCRVEDTVTWLLPIYMTVQVLRHKEKLKYNNSFIRTWQN